MRQYFHKNFTLFHDEDARSNNPSNPQTTLFNYCKITDKDITRLYYVFFWVFPRRLIVVCRRFRTLYRFHLHPALEDGTDRGVRNVGIQQSDAGETPKRIHNRFKTRRKFEIKNY